MTFWKTDEKKKATTSRPSSEGKTNKGTGEP
jgi:hypothetical protein